MPKAISACIKRGSRLAGLRLGRMLGMIGLSSLLGALAVQLETPSTHPSFRVSFVLPTHRCDSLSPGPYTWRWRSLSIQSHSRNHETLADAVRLTRVLHPSHNILGYLMSSIALNHLCHAQGSEVIRHVIIAKRASMEMFFPNCPWHT